MMGNNIYTVDTFLGNETKEEIKLAFRIFLLIQPLREQHLTHTDTFRMAKEILKTRNQQKLALASV